MLFEPEHLPCSQYETMWEGFPAKNAQGEARQAPHLTCSFNLRAERSHVASIFSSYIKLWGSQEQWLTHLNSRDAAIQAHSAAWNQLYLFNYAAQRRRHFSNAVPATHELMMHISGCY